MPTVVCLPPLFRGYPNDRNRGAGKADRTVHQSQLGARGDD